MAQETPELGPLERDQSTQPSLRNKLGWSTAGTIASRGSGALAGVLVARFLGPTGRGQYAVLIAIASVLTAVSTAGLQFWIIRTVALGETISSIRPIVRRHFSYLVPSALAIALAIRSVVPQTSVTTGELAATIFLLLLTTFALLTLAVVNGLQRMRRVATATTVGAGTYLLALIVIETLNWTKPSTTVAAAALGQVMTALTCVPTLTLRKVGVEGLEKPDYFAAIRFGFPAAVGEMLLLICMRLDILMVATLMGTREAGLYAVATALSELTWIIPDGTSQVLLPMASEGTPVKASFKIIIRAVLLQALAGMALMSLAPILIPTIFGSNFKGAVRIVPILILAALGLGAWKLLAADLAGRGHTRARGISTLVGLLLLLISQPLLIGRYSLQGAAMASCIAYWSATAYLLYIYRRRT
ncbi:MAG: oligosaccharide flippase family protein [Acidimicrobiales bacterium]|nr:oligosaccharide flippase family protein [Acidimicrobiales bacterium]